MKYAVLAFLVVTCLPGIYSGLYEALKMGGKEFETCTGMVLSRVVGEKWSLIRDMKTLVYWPQVEFEFEHEGRLIRGNRIALARGYKTTDKAQAEKRLHRFIPGQKRTIYFNKLNPEECYLDNPRNHLKWLVVGAVLAAMSIALLSWLW